MFTATHTVQVIHVSCYFVFWSYGRSAMCVRVCVFAFFSNKYKGAPKPFLYCHSDISLISPSLCYLDLKTRAVTLSVLALSYTFQFSFTALIQSQSGHSWQQALRIETVNFSVTVAVSCCRRSLSAVNVYIEVKGLRAWLEQGRRSR
jgi:hypothetical protein